MLSVIAESTCQQPYGGGCDPDTPLGWAVFGVGMAAVGFLGVRIWMERRRPGWWRAMVPRVGPFARGFAIGLGICAVPVAVLAVADPAVGLGVLSIGLVLFAFVVGGWIVVRFLVHAGRSWYAVRSRLAASHTADGASWRDAARSRD